MPAINLASKYSNVVSERFIRESFVAGVLNNDYDFTGVNEVKVYSIPVVPMGNYTRSGANRYGTPQDLTRNVQTLTIKRDRSFTYAIDRGDNDQSMMVTEAGRTLSRQQEEVVIPEFDNYVFKALAAAATEAGNFDDTEATKANAYSIFLAANEKMSNANVPDTGRVAYCSYRFANLLKQDPAFSRDTEITQNSLIKGTIGEVDGCVIVKVPSGRLPAGAACLLVHGSAACAPQQLQDYRIHDNPPGINGWLVEGRYIYDCFVLNEKTPGVYYIGAQPVLKELDAMTAASNIGKSTIIVTSELEGAKRYYQTADKFESLDKVTYGTAITTGNFTEMTSTPDTIEITPTATHTVAQIVDVDTAGKPIAVKVTPLHIG